MHRRGSARGSRGRPGPGSSSTRRARRRPPRRRRTGREPVDAAVVPISCSRRVGRCAAGGWSPVGRLAAPSLRRVSSSSPARVAYGGLFSHAYPGDVGTYARLRPRARAARADPVPRFLRRVPARRRCRVFALPVLIWNAHYVLVFKLLWPAAGVGFVRLLGLDRAPARAELAAARADRPRAGADGARLPQPVRPVPALLTSLALVALPRRPRADGRRAARRRHRDQALPGHLRPPRRPAGALAGRRRRRPTCSRRPCSSLPFLLIAPGGVGFSLWTQLAPLADREPRLLDPARRARSSGSTTGLDRRQAGLDRPRRAARPTRSACISAVVAVGARPRRRLGVLARPGRRRPAGHRLGGGRHRLRRVREGPLAAVPDLARPARPARRRPQGALGGGRLPRRPRR